MTPPVLTVKPKVSSSVEKIIKRARQIPFSSVHKAAFGENGDHLSLKELKVLAFRKVAANAGTPKSYSRLRAHLGGCQDCREVLAAFRRAEPLAGLEARLPGRLWRFVQKKFGQKKVAA